MEVLEIHNAERAIQVFNMPLDSQDKQSYYWENQQGNLIRLDNIDERYKNNILKLLEKAVVLQDVYYEDIF